MINEGIADEWPPEVIEAANKFQLGDLIERPPLCYGGGNGHVLWQSATAVSGSPGLLAVNDDSQPPYGIITSQTCDVAERGDHKEQPWIQVSPVYELDPGADLGGKIFLHQLTADRFTEGAWVADLRLEVPLEKGILVGREPISGFANEQDAVDFAERLGRRRDRAALADAVNDVLYRRLSKRMANNKNRAKRVFDEIHSVGLAITEGTRLEPVAVQVHFVTVAGDIDAETREWFETWWDSARQDASNNDPSLNLLPNVYHDGASMNLRIYDGLIPLAWSP